MKRKKSDALMGLVTKIFERDSGVRDGEEGRRGPRRFRARVKDSIGAESSQS